MKPLRARAFKMNQQSSGGGGGGGGGGSSGKALDFGFARPGLKARSHNPFYKTIEMLILDFMRVCTTNSFVFSLEI